MNERRLKEHEDAEVTPRTADAGDTPSRTSPPRYPNSGSALSGSGVSDPLLSIEEVACLLKMSTGAVVKVLGGRPDGDDGELGEKLRACVVRLSPRRRYIAARPFLSWIEARVQAICSEREKGGELTK